MLDVEFRKSFQDSYLNASLDFRKWNNETKEYDAPVILIDESPVKVCTIVLFIRVGGRLHPYTKELAQSSAKWRIRGNTTTKKGVFSKIETNLDDVPRSLIDLVLGEGKALEYEKQILTEFLGDLVVSWESVNNLLTSLGDGAPHE